MKAAEGAAEKEATPRVEVTGEPEKEEPKKEEPKEAKGIIININIHVQKVLEKMFCRFVSLGCKRCCESWTNGDWHKFIFQHSSWRTVFAEHGDHLMCLHCSPLVWFITRVVIASIWFGIVIADIVRADPFWFYPVLLTNWTAWTVLLYFLLAAFTTGMAVFTPSVDGQDLKTPFYASVTWYMFCIAPALALLVTILFWTLDYNPDAGTLGVLDVLLHGGNNVLLFWDLLLNNQPYCWAHVWVPVTFAVVYSLFTLIYYLAGGVNRTGQRYIYEVLDWSKGSTIGLVFAIVFVATRIAYTICWSMAKCCRCCQIREIGEEDVAESDAGAPDDIKV